MMRLMPNSGRGKVLQNERELIISRVYRVYLLRRCDSDPVGKVCLDVI